MKIVTPFRPFAPESEHHQKLGAFDWIGAIEMLRASARAFGRCETFVITDVDAMHLFTHPSTHGFQTTHRRLMLWILDVTLCYLRSDAFDDDTVLVSPDVLVFGDLRRGFRADLGLLVRTSQKFARKPLQMVLNSAQWWRLEAKDRLIDFYARALTIAQTLTEERIVWGADTDPLVRLVAPVTAGISERSGLTVCGHELGSMMSALGPSDISALDSGRVPQRPAAPLFDFKYHRKTSMRRYFDAVVGSAAA